jgi:hypothetical protein
VKISIQSNLLITAFVVANWYLPETKQKQTYSTDNINRVISRLLTQANLLTGTAVYCTHLAQTVDTNLHFSLNFTRTQSVILVKVDELFCKNFCKSKMDNYGTINNFNRVL